MLAGGSIDGVYIRIALSSTALGTIMPMLRDAGQLHTSGQFAVRLVLLIVVSLVALSLVLGLDVLLGAFAAGILARIVLQHCTETHKVTIERKLEAISFGFFVPAFFIIAGATFDFASLASDPHALVLVPVFLVLLLVVRGIPGSFAAPQGAGRAQRSSLALFSATGLPIIIAVTGIALNQHAMKPGVAAALVAAGMLSVLLFPLLALITTHHTAEDAEPDRSADRADLLLDR